jgi:hypothetical protein
MARYTASLSSVAALADDTGFAWVMGSAAAGGKVRRVVIGCRNTAAATAVTDFQCKVGINRVTADGVTITAGTWNKCDARHPTAGMRIATGWATVPTQGAEATDFFSIPFNAKSGVDLPAEFLEEYWIDRLVTDGFAFVNRSGALPAAHVFDFTVETEE